MVHSSLEEFLEKINRGFVYDLISSEEFNKLFIKYIEQQDEVVFDVINSPFYSNYINWIYIIKNMKKTDFSDRIQIPLYAQYMNNYMTLVTFKKFLESDNLDQTMLDHLFIKSRPNGNIELIKNSKYFSDSIHKSILKYISKDNYNYLNDLIGKNPTEEFITKTLDFIVEMKNKELFFLVIKNQNIKFLTNPTEKMINFMIEHDIKNPRIINWPNEILPFVQQAVQFKNDYYLSLFISQNMITTLAVNYILDQKYIPGITMLAHKSIINKSDKEVLKFLKEFTEYNFLFEYYIFDKLFTLETVDVEKIEKILSMTVNEDERIRLFKSSKLNKNKEFIELFYKFSSNKAEFFKNIL